MADRIQQRRDTRARWEEFNPLLLEGEVGYVTDDPNRYKIGDGINRWNSLPCRGFDGTIVQETGNAENAVMSQKAVSEKLSELGSKVNNRITVENVSPYNSFEIGGYISAGTTIVNNGVPIIVANSSNLDGRVDIATAQQVTVSEDKMYFQTSEKKGTVDFNLILYPKYSDSVKKVFQYKSVGEYWVLPYIIPKGCVVVNKGVTLIIASDEELEDRIDLNSGDCIYANTDKKLIKSKEAGDVLFEVVSLSESVIFNKHISDRAISKEKVDFITPLNIVGNVTYGQYHDGTSIGVNQSYDLTDFIQIKVGENYCWNVMARFVVVYNNKKQIVRTLSNIYKLNDIGETEAYMRITFYASDDKLYQVEEGDSLSIYTSPNQTFIDKNILPPTDNNNKTFSGFRDIKNLATNETFVLPKVKITKNILLTALLQGHIESVTIGVGQNDYYGKNITITPTDIIVRGEDDNHIISSVQHGITITGFVSLNVSKDNDAIAKIRLFNDKGEIYKSEINWGTSYGQPFVKNESSKDVNVIFNFTPRDINQPIWMFGDSYFGMYAKDRWLYYPVQEWGYDNFLVNARGGDRAEDAITDLRTILKLGAVPKYIVWCMGMNNGADNGVSVNPSWLSSTTQMIDLCKQNNIIPILATIPSIPSDSHVNLNAWVRSSGYRYIDFAAAVEENGSVYWKGWGSDDALLGGDKIHPTVKGAIVLAAQAMIDFPEMSIMI